MKIFAVLVVLIVSGLALWVRLAPSDPARWHVAVLGAPEQFADGVLEVVPGDQAMLARMAEIAQATPRTRLLAGSTDEGRLTFVTRSRFWRFPDYTTLELRGGQIYLHARLRFGRSDFGVNAARIQDWLKRAQAIQR